MSAFIKVKYETMMKTLMAENWYEERGGWGVINCTNWFSLTCEGSLTGPGWGQTKNITAFKGGRFDEYLYKLGPLTHLWYSTGWPQYLGNGIYFPVSLSCWCLVADGSRANFFVVLSVASYQFSVRRGSSQLTVNAKTALIHWLTSHRIINQIMQNCFIYSQWAWLLLTLGRCLALVNTYTLTQSDLAC